MKRYRFLAVCALCGVLAAALIVVFIGARRENRQLTKIERQRADVCSNLMSELEAIVTRNDFGSGLRARIRFHHLNLALTRMCLGTDLPAVGASEADACWIASGREDCYLDVAKKLLELHRAQSLK